MGYSPQGHKESDTTEQLTLHYYSLSFSVIIFTLRGCRESNMSKKECARAPWSLMFLRRTRHSLCVQSQFSCAWRAWPPSAVDSLTFSAVHVMYLPRICSESLWTPMYMVGPLEFCALRGVKMWYANRVARITGHTRIGCLLCSHACFIAPQTSCAEHEFRDKIPQSFRTTIAEHYHSTEPVLARELMRFSRSPGQPNKYSALPND